MAIRAKYLLFSPKTKSVHEVPFVFLMPCYHSLNVMAHLSASWSCVVLINIFGCSLICTPFSSPRPSAPLFKAPDLHLPYVLLRLLSPCTYWPHLCVFTVTQTDLSCWTGLISATETLTYHVNRAWTVCTCCVEKSMSGTSVHMLCGKKHVRNHVWDLDLIALVLHSTCNCLRVVS